MNTADSYNTAKASTSATAASTGTDTTTSAGTDIAASASTAASTSAKPCICIRLRRIAQRVTDQYDKALAPVGISINQYSLLVNMSRMEGCSTGALAKRVGLEKSTLVRTLKPLLREGLVEDKALAGSRRRQLHVSDKGHALLAKARPLWSAVQDEVAVRLGKSHEELMELFARVDVWE